MQSDGVRCCWWVVILVDNKLFPSASQLHIPYEEIAKLALSGLANFFAGHVDYYLTLHQPQQHLRAFHLILGYTSNRRSLAQQP